jgi:glycine/D-amino acid oxidase-like deaminating enzyme
MSHVVVIGCGVVGAAIAYELSLVPRLKVTVLDRQPPAQGATSAALGVMMGAISKKVKGRAWQLRHTSMQRYETLIPELESLTKTKIPFNRQGILKLCFEGEKMSKWEELAQLRESQGLPLKILNPAQVRAQYPQLGQLDTLIAAVYSRSDRQVHPVSLTQALVGAAQRQGVTFQFDVTVEGFKANDEHSQAGTWERGSSKVQNSHKSVTRVYTTRGDLTADWVVIAAGLGSTPLTVGLEKPVKINPVLGQAVQLRLDHPLGNPDWQPVITGDDVLIVPCKNSGTIGSTDYWVGATVEFPVQGSSVVADESLLEEVLNRAIAFCPDLATATVVKKWSGLRPRPEQQSAPVLGPLPGYDNVLLATGHYRNGVLLAPASAIAIRDAIVM